MTLHWTAKLNACLPLVFFSTALSHPPIDVCSPSTFLSLYLCSPHEVAHVEVWQDCFC